MESLVLWLYYLKKLTNNVWTDHGLRHCGWPCRCDCVGAMLALPLVFILPFCSLTGGAAALWNCGKRANAITSLDVNGARTIRLFLFLSFQSLKKFIWAAIYYVNCTLTACYPATAPAQSVSGPTNRRVEAASANVDWFNKWVYTAVLILVLTFTTCQNANNSLEKNVMGR